MYNIISKYCIHDYYGPYANSYIYNIHRTMKNQSIRINAFTKDITRNYSQRNDLTALLATNNNALCWDSNIHLSSFKAKVHLLFGLIY
jgi:hypothetical protein